MLVPPPTSPEGSAAREKQPTPPAAPLTDPADLFALLGRFVACGILSVLTVVYIFRQLYVFAVVFGVLSLVVQRATIKLWRRLRDERLAAEEAAAAARESGEVLP